MLTSLHAADGEPAVVVDSASFEATSMDNAGMTIMDVDAGVGAYLEEPSTPRATSSPNIADSCKEHSKPMVGMTFDTLTDVENFYKDYAHEAGFSVRVGQHKKQNEEIFYKRFFLLKGRVQKGEGTRC